MALPTKKLVAELQSGGPCSSAGVFEFRRGEALCIESLQLGVQSTRSYSRPATRTYARPGYILAFEASLACRSLQSRDKVGPPACKEFFPYMGAHALISDSECAPAPSDCTDFGNANRLRDTRAVAGPSIRAYRSKL